MGFADNPKRLSDSSQLPEMGQLRSGSSDAAGWRTVAFDEIDSTNAEAMRRAANGERGPLALRADRQVAGRGRVGRAWSSPAGNLSLSLLFSPHCTHAVLPQLSLVAGVAACQALRGAVADGNQTTAGNQPSQTAARSGPFDAIRLKWPNDLLFADAAMGSFSKLGGILVECSLFGADIVAVAGIGMNLAIAPEVPGRAVTCTASLGLAHAIDPEDLSRAVAGQMSDWLSIWDGGAGFARIREAWLDRALPIGTVLQVKAGERVMSGEFGGLDDDGALLLGTRAGTQRIDFGDVSVGPLVEIK